MCFRGAARVCTAGPLVCLLLQAGLASGVLVYARDSSCADQRGQPRQHGAIIASPGKEPLIWPRRTRIEPQWHHHDETGLKTRGHVPHLLPSTTSRSFQHSGQQRCGRYAERLGGSGPTPRLALCRRKRTADTFTTFTRKRLGEGRGRGAQLHQLQRSWRNATCTREELRRHLRSHRAHAGPRLIRSAARRGWRPSSWRAGGFCRTKS